MDTSGRREGAGNDVTGFRDQRNVPLQVVVGVDLYRVVNQ
jgi:hypothetical protein